MTRYVCGHPSHRRGSEAGRVDVTAQVRAARAMLPRPSAYLAITEDIIEAVMELDERSNRRVGQIRRLISGVAEPQDLPVVLMSRRSITREPGRYELDDLREGEPAIDRIAQRLGASHVLASPPDDDLVIIEDEPVSGPPATETARSSTTLLTRQPQRRQVLIPQGLFHLDDLAGSLAIADPTEPALIDAIRSTPLYETRTIVPTDPWRVVITCPKPEGSPAATHDMLFTGNGDAESAIVYGTPVDAWDAEVDAGALADMAPRAETSRVERRVWTMLGAEVLILVALLGAAWVSGGLGLAARETGAWLGLSLVLAGSAIAFAALPLFAVREAGANMNDTLVLQRLYGNRVSLLRWAAAASGTLFGLALLAGVIPPLTLEGRPIPAATVTFDTSSQPVTATMRVTATGVGEGDVVSATMREYGAGDEAGALVGHVTREGSPSGEVSWTETFALDANASYVSVLVTGGDTPNAACSPSVTGTPGCTVLAVPQVTSTTGRVTAIIVPSPATTLPAGPAASASPSVVGTPSATSSPTP